MDSHSHHSNGRYQNEIGSMMFTFGEVRHPLPETTLLMEQIVHSQITRLLQQAASISKRRGSRFINQEDLLFIVRKNRELVSRLKNYLSWRKVRKIANRTGTANTAVPAEVDEDILDTEAVDESKGKVKKQKIHLPWETLTPYHELLEKIGDSDSEEDDDEEFYESTRRWLQQQDMYTRTMTLSEYTDFAECRQASFTYKKPTKFKDWLNVEKQLNIRLNNDLLDVIGFICYGMVQKLTEQALAIKKEMEANQVLDSSSSAAAAGTGVIEKSALQRMEKEIKEQYKTMDLFARPNEYAPLEVSHLQEAYRRLSINDLSLTGVASQLNSTSHNQYISSFRNCLGRRAKARQALQIL